MEKDASSGTGDVDCSLAKTEQHKQLKQERDTGKHEKQSSLKHEDVWLNMIFPFLGMGQYGFVAPVSHKMKHLYLAYCETVGNPPKIDELDDNGELCLATHTATFYNAICSSVARAEYWYSHSHTGTGGQIDANQVCAAAAKVGSLEVIQWAKDKGFHWNRDTSKNAAAYGHLELLKYLHENGCPWDWRTCCFAAENGHLEVLKYAIENGCPWNQQDLLIIGTPQVKAWIQGMS
ncbi:expressed unknown protein [Seminavis robusta]|uniref:Ankyrin repeat-containing domain n=1 Tax=Seminavis robusta TaxID=568900 RepID=A0A9N8DFV0_9STRA|nr:expressed unknown protein [Seminavis robusta]|eukprot:Sro72_g039641.1  (234) ;mRNA; f:7805-8506